MVKIVKPQKYYPAQSIDYIQRYIANADVLIEYLYNLPVDERLEYDDDSILKLHNLRDIAQKDLDNLLKSDDFHDYKRMNYHQIVSQAKMQKVATIVVFKQRMDYLSTILAQVSYKLTDLSLVPDHEKFLVVDLEQQLKDLRQNIESEIHNLDQNHKQDQLENNKSNLDYEQLKQQAMSYPISQILFEFGYKPVNRGNRQMYYSFLRKEKSPSLVVYVDQNTAYDYGAGKYFDAISLYMELANANFKETIKTLSKFS
jgi:hypothetical protein